MKKRSLKKFPNGGKIPNEDFSYQRFRSSLPNNLQSEDPSYNLRGWWESLGKPEKFEPFNYNLYNGEYDGPNREFNYHGSTRNPETGEILKGKLHPTLLKGLEDDAKAGYYPYMKDRKIYTTNPNENMEYKKGGTIHIKPENRGKFNATKARTGKTTEELTHSKNPLTRKRAIFAQNAKKWKHEEGGLIEYDGGGSINGDRLVSMGGKAGDMTLPGIGFAVQANQMLGDMTSDEYGAPKDGLAGYMNRINPMENLSRALEGKDVGRSLLGLTPLGGLSEATGLSKKLFGESYYDKEAKKREDIIKSNEITSARLGGPNLSINNLAVNNSNMYPHGGVVVNDQPGANAELELQEQMQLPDGTVMGVDGPSHENGGIEVNAPEGTRVFSDRLKLDGKTYAKHAKTINNKIAKLDKKPETTATKNTTMLFEKQLDDLFNTQEAVKEMKAQKKMFANGGTIPAEKNGMITAHNVRVMRKGGLVKYPGDKDPGIIIANEDSDLASLGYTGRTSPTVEDLGPDFLSVFSKTNTGKPLNNSAGLSTYSNPRIDAPNLSGQAGAFASTLLSNMAQSAQANKVSAPRTLGKVTFTAGARPNNVSFSSERSTIDAESAAAKRGLMLGSGSYSTQAANLQKIRNAQLMGKGTSFEKEATTNTGIQNAYLKDQATAYNQGVQANLGVDQYNIDNLQNYQLWKAGNKMKSTASTGDTMTNLFNNQTSYANQLAIADILRRKYEPTVAEGAGFKKKYGGKIRSLKRK